MIIGCLGVSERLAPLEYGEYQMGEETRMSSSNESNLLTGQIGEEDRFLAAICPVATSTKPSVAGRVELIQSDALAFLWRQRDVSVDIVASKYVIPDFVNDYAQQVFVGIRRVIAASGLFTATKH